MAEITERYRDLFIQAKQMLKNAYAPYSGFPVGAALLVKGEDKVFTGVNVENASYGAAICAERTACTAAVAAGYREFEAVAVVSGRGAVPMCGICRQFLSEFSPEMDVITSHDEDHLEVRKLCELFPESFKL